MLLTGSWQASLGAFCMHFDGIVQHVRTKFKVWSIRINLAAFSYFFVVSILNLSVFCWSHSLCSPFLQTESWGTKPCLWRWRLWAEKSCEVQNGAERMLGDVGRCWEMLNAERCSWNFWEFIQLRFLFRVFQTQGISSRSRKRLTQEIQEIRLLWSAILLRRRSPLALVLLATLAWRPKRLMHADCDRVIDREVCGHLWTPKCETFKIWLSVKWKCGITLSLKFHRAMNETLKWECSQECWHLYWAACMAELLNSHAFPQRNILHDEMRFAKF